MTLTAHLANGARPLEGGTLTWRVTQPAGVYHPLQPDFITYTNANSGLASDAVNDVFVDSEGNVWFATAPVSGGGPGEMAGGGVSILLTGGAWITYTTANSLLPSDDIRAIAVDDAGNAWFATAPYWDDQLEREVGARLSLRRAGGTWTVYTATHGFPDCIPTSLALRRDGQVWLACEWEEETNSPALFSFSPECGEFVTHPVTSTHGGLPSNRVTDLAVDGMGDLWVTTAGGAGRYTGLTRVLWQSTLPVDLAGGAKPRPLRPGRRTGESLPA